MAEGYCVTWGAAFVGGGVPVAHNSTVTILKKPTSSRLGWQTNSHPLPTRRCYLCNYHKILCQKLIIQRIVF